MFLSEIEQTEIRKVLQRGTEAGRKSRGMIADFASYNKSLPRLEDGGIKNFVVNSIENYLALNLERHEVGVTQLCGLNESQYAELTKKLDQEIDSRKGRFSIKIYKNYVNVPLPFFNNPVLIADLVIFDNDCAHVGEYKEEFQFAEAN